jgi:hypothetical protein
VGSPLRDGAEPPLRAGFLHVLPELEEEGWRGALLVLGPRGEPLEFSYCVETSSGPDGAARLVAALLAACPRPPDLLLERADGLGLVPPGDSTPICRVADGGVVWPSDAPPRLSAFADRLGRSGLLTEPFARAEAGLRLVLEPAA